MKIKILFNGFRHSHIYGLYKKALEDERFQIVGCIEENEDARASASGFLGAVFSDNNYAELLQGDVDVVAIGNAYGERGKNIIAALKAGKHVIADKPICTDILELKEIERLSSEKRLSVVCMLDLRYIPQVIEAKKILDSGELGEIRNVSFGGQHYLDYGKRPGWYYEKGMHGGTLNDLAIHGIDLVRMLTGQEFTSVDSARVWNSYATEQKEFKDSAVFMARLDGGASVMADVSYSAPSQVFSMPTYWEFRFWCERGMLTFSYTLPRVTVYKNGEDAPREIECSSSESSWLCDLARVLKEGDGGFTINTLKSCETALRIQAIAEREDENLTKGSLQYEA